MMRFAAEAIFLVTGVTGMGRFVENGTTGVNLAQVHGVADMAAADEGMVSALKGGRGAAVAGAGCSIRRNFNFSCFRSSRNRRATATI